MADAQTDRMFESITKQLEVICKILGIEAAPMPNDINYDPTIIDEQLDLATIQEQLDPDA